MEIKFHNTKPTNQPLVSVIVPCYNLAQYLPETVESLVKQTFTDWECIIVNDGSTDNTSQVAREIIAKYPDKRIYLLEKENGGAADARNFGIRHSKGAFILPLDADDILHPNFLEKTVDVLINCNWIHLVYTDYVEFGAWNKYVQTGDWNPQRLLFQNILCYCCLFRKEVWKAIGGYNPTMPGYEDWDFWIGCAEKGFTGLRIPQVLFFYRIRENSKYHSRSIKRDKELKAKIILNHPTLYSKIHLMWAKAVISGETWTYQVPNQIGIIPTSIPMQLLPHQYSQKFAVSATPNFKSPKVTVVVPTFNRPIMLRNAIQSILNQSYQNFEIIVVNDAGEDVRNIVQSFNDERIKYISQPQHRGSAATRNIALKNASGTYICYLDDDDFFLPHHLETLVNFLDNNSHYKFVYSDALRVHQVRIQNNYVNVKQDIPYSRDFDRVELLFGNYIPILCIMHYRDILDEIGVFDETLTTHVDWDLWIRISRKYPFYHLKNITCAFTWRVDGSSLSSSMREDFFRTMKIIHAKNKPLFLEEIERAISEGNLELAESIAIRMMDIFNPQNHPEPLIDLGVIRSLQNRIEEAKQIFRIALDLHPNNEIARENIEILEQEFLSSEKSKI